EIGAAEQVLRIARALVLGIFLGDRGERGFSLRIFLLRPQVIARHVGILGGIPRGWSGVGLGRRHGGEGLGSLGRQPGTGGVVRHRRGGRVGGRGRGGGFERL